MGGLTSAGPVRASCLWLAVFVGFRRIVNKETVTLGGGEGRAQAGAKHLTYIILWESHSFCFGDKEMEIL